MKNLLEGKIDKISDDFKSTFIYISPNILSNLLRGEHEFEEVTNIIKKHCGHDISVKITKTGSLSPDPYDLYIIELSKQ
jgi:hypothetical protein